MGANIDHVTLHIASAMAAVEQGRSCLEASAGFSQAIGETAAALARGLEEAAAETKNGHKKARAAKAAGQAALHDHVQGTGILEESVSGAKGGDALLERAAEIHALYEGGNTFAHSLSYRQKQLAKEMAELR